MGHFTVLAPSVDEALAKAARGRGALRWIDRREAALR
jgi:hypothetical protein